MAAVEDSSTMAGPLSTRRCAAGQEWHRSAGYSRVRACRGRGRIGEGVQHRRVDVQGAGILARDRPYLLEVAERPADHLAHRPDARGKLLPVHDHGTGAGDLIFEKPGYPLGGMVQRHILHECGQLPRATGQHGDGARRHARIACQEPGQHGDRHQADAGAGVDGLRVRQVGAAISCSIISCAMPTG